MKYHYLDTGTLNRYLADQCERGNPDLNLKGSDALLKQLPTVDKEGWDIFRLMDDESFLGLYDIVAGYIHRRLLPYGQPGPGFTPETYHEHIQDDAIHYAVSSWALLPQVLEPYYTRIKEKMEALTGMPLRLKEIEHRDEKGTFLGFRIVRPGKADYSPIHRDAWLPYWRNTINVWLPICGFSQGNTLCVLPGSHRIPDQDILRTKRGASIQGRVYHVPAAVGLLQENPIIKPVLQPGEALIFSPYLLHGNGVNNHPRETRISLEIRFCAQTD